VKEFRESRLEATFKLSLINKSFGKFYP